MRKTNALLGHRDSTLAVAAVRPNDAAGPEGVADWEPNSDNHEPSTASLREDDEPNHQQRVSEKWHKGDSTRSLF